MGPGLVLTARGAERGSAVLGWPAVPLKGMLAYEWRQLAPVFRSGCHPLKGCLGASALHAARARGMGARHQLCRLPWVLGSDRN